MYTGLGFPWWSGEGGAGRICMLELELQAYNEELARLD
jgi:hypothetical protein